MLLVEYKVVISGITFLDISVHSGVEMHREYVVIKLINILSFVFSLGRRATTMWPLFLGGIFCVVVSAIPEKAGIRKYILP